MYIQSVPKHPDTMPFLQTLLSHTAQQTSSSSTISAELQYIRSLFTGSLHRSQGQIIPTESDVP